MTSLGKSSEFSSSGTNKYLSSGDNKTLLKNSMDREYKLLTSNQSPPRISNNNSGEGQLSSREKRPDNDLKPFEKSVSERLEAILGERKQDQDNGNVENNHYKQGLQNLRNSMNTMKEKQQKNTLASTAKESIKSPSENATGLEKEQIKRVQNEREGQLGEKREKVAYPNVERNPVDSVGKKNALISYERKEREVNKRIMNGSQEKDYGWESTSFSRLQRDLRQTGSPFNQTGKSDRNDVLERSPDNLQAIEERQERSNLEMRNDIDDKLDGSYFTNKDLVRAKYEKYEEELEKRIQKGNEKKFSKVGGPLKTKEASPERRFNDYAIGPIARNPEEEEQRRVRDQIDREYKDRVLTDKRKQDYKRVKVDEFQRALEKREQMMKDEYESLEKQKGWSSKSLVYRDGLYHAEGSPREHIVEPVYSPNKPLKEEILSCELKKLRDENHRIKREIVEIHQRNSIDQRCRSEKLTKDDLRASYQRDNLAGSMRLNETRKARDYEDSRVQTEFAKEDDIKKTIQKARKGVHKKLEMNKQERTWSEAKKKKSLEMTCQEMYLSLRDSAYIKKFNAGTPKTHLRESSYLLAHGIPTSYMGDRSLDKIFRSSKRSTSRSNRK